MTSWRRAWSQGREALVSDSSGDARGNPNYDADGLLPAEFFNDGPTIIANGASLFFGLCAGSFLAISALGLFWNGVTKAGAHAGFLSGLAVSVVILCFVFEKVSKLLGLCEAMFDVPSLGAGTPFKNVDPLVFAVPVSFS